MTDTWKSVLKGHTMQGEDQLNVFYHSTAADKTDALTALNQFITEWCGDCVPIMHPDSGFDSAEFYTWDGTSWHPEGIETLTVVGNSGGVAIPPQNAAVLLGDTNVKRCRPKKFIGGLTSTDLSNGQLGSVALGYLASLLGLWISGFVFGSATMTPGTFRKIAHVFVPMMGGLVDGLVGSQRKRKQNVGV
jgi:hypothetical protein